MPILAGSCFNKYIRIYVMSFAAFFCDVAIFLIKLEVLQFGAT